MEYGDGGIRRRLSGLTSQEHPTLPIVGADQRRSAEGRVQTWVWLLRRRRAPQRASHRSGSVATPTPSAPPARPKVFTFGHVWVVLALFVPLPFARRGFALPILFRLYRSEKHCLVHGTAFCKKTEARARDARPRGGMAGAVAPGEPRGLVGARAHRPTLVPDQDNSGLPGRPSSRARARPESERSSRRPPPTSPPAPRAPSRSPPAPPRRTPATPR